MCKHARGNISLNFQQMALFIIREKIGLHLLRTDQDPVPKNVLLLLLLRSNPNRQHSKYYISGGVRRRGKTGKNGKVEVKRK